MIEQWKIILLSCLFLISGVHATDHLVFEGEKELSKGKHIVFLAGDEEYRSEEALPMMAQMMAQQGFKCTVLFSMDKQNKYVNPDNQQSLSHPQALDSADLIVMALRFRRWNDAAMEKFVAAFERGTPIVALRTSTHAFKFPPKSKWAKYSFKAKESTGWKKGFGRQVLGETWINHHGRHKVEGCRTKVEKENKNHPILNGVGTIFVKSDVYGVDPKKPFTTLLRGAVTKTLDANSLALKGKKNSPMMPVAWTREYKHQNGTLNKIFTTTMGAATDLLDANLRRLVANGIYWGLEMKIPQKVDVTLPGEYNPTMFSFRGYKKQHRPEDFIVKKKIHQKLAE